MNIETLIEKYQLNEAEAQALRFMEQNKSHLKKIKLVLLQWPIRETR